MENNTNIIETLRKASVEKLFQLGSFSSSFPVWATYINDLTFSRTPKQVLDLGDYLSECFALTKTQGRSQSEVSGGGAAWEAR